MNEIPMEGTSEPIMPQAPQPIAEQPAPAPVAPVAAVVPQPVAVQQTATAAVHGVMDESRHGKSHVGALLGLMFILVVGAGGAAVYTEAIPLDQIPGLDQFRSAAPVEPAWQEVVLPIVPEVEMPVVEPVVGSGAVTGSGAAMTGSGSVVTESGATVEVETGSGEIVTESGAIVE